MRLSIFDFDGTLADTRLNIVLTMRETMRGLRLPEADERKRTMPPKPFPGAAELLAALRGCGGRATRAASLDRRPLAGVGFPP